MGFKQYPPQPSLIREGKNNYLKRTYSLKKKTAFTLAEVLITLGIIGVVAAMTIPTIIGNYKKQEITSKLKKFSSTMQNALNMATTEYGDISTWQNPTTQGDEEETNKFFTTYILPFLSGVKNCSAGVSDRECSNLRQGFAPDAPNRTNASLFVFNDGSCFSLYTGGADTLHANIHFLYDYNCKGKPNEYDKDKFSFILLIDSLNNSTLRNRFRAGSASTHELTNRDDLLDACNKHTQTHYRGGCSALIQFDGREIKDDYPWIH